MTYTNEKVYNMPVRIINIQIPIEAKYLGVTSDAKVHRKTHVKKKRKHLGHLKM